MLRRNKTKTTCLATLTIHAMQDMAHNKGYITHFIIKFEIYIYGLLRIFENTNGASAKP